MRRLGPWHVGQQDHVLITTKSIGIPIKISVGFQCSHERTKHISIYSGSPYFVLIDLKSLMSVNA